MVTSRAIAIADSTSERAWRGCRVEVGLCQWADSSRGTWESDKLGKWYRSWFNREKRWDFVSTVVSAEGGYRAEVGWCHWADSRRGLCDIGNKRMRTSKDWWWIKRKEWSSTVVVAEWGCQVEAGWSHWADSRGDSYQGRAMMNEVRSLSDREFLNGFYIGSSNVMDIGRRIIIIWAYI